MEADFQVYTRRWLILGAFSVLSFVQSMSWLTYSAFTSHSRNLFGLPNDDLITLLLIIGTGGFLVILPFTSYWFERVQLPWLVRGGSALVLVSCLMRLFARSRGTYAVAAVAAALNTCAGGVVMAGPPLLTAMWFPPRQRGFATSVAVSSNQLGSAAAFLFAYMVTSVATIPRMIYAEIGFAALASLLVLYFPGHPPSPPCASQMQEVHRRAPISLSSYFGQLRALMKKPSFLVLVLVAGLSQGVFIGWSSLLDEFMEEKNFSQNTAGLVAFAATVSGILGAVILGAVSDGLGGRSMKALIIFSFFAACACFVVFTLTVLGVIFSAHDATNSVTVADAATVPPAKTTVTGFWVLVISAALGSLFVNAVSPLVFEMGAELAYPVEEGLVGSVIAFVVNAATLALLIAQSYVPTLVMNIINTASAGLAGILLLLFMKEEYTRRNADDEQSCTTERLLKKTVND